MRGRIALVLLGWLGAFLIVMILFLLFGKRLQELPLAVRALVISGVLTVSMTQVVMPFISRRLRMTGGTPPSDTTRGSTTT